MAGTSICCSTGIDMMRGLRSMSLCVPLYSLLLSLLTCWVLLKFPKGTRHAWHGRVASSGKELTSSKGSSGNADAPRCVGPVSGDEVSDCKAQHQAILGNGTCSLNPQKTEDTSSREGQTL